MLIVEHKGSGVLNSLINKLPVELHIPKYQYCGPGTRLDTRLARGDQGINPLDAACKEHDIAYSQNKSLKHRHAADYVLENKAWNRVKSKDASLGEKAAAWLVTTAMKTKRKMGMGLERRNRHRHRPLSFQRDIVGKIKNTLNANPPATSLKQSALSALKAARVLVKKAGGRKRIRVPRIIPFETKTGGILPLLPILGALGALGSLAGGASAVAKTVLDAKNAKKKLEEDQRHNRAMEAKIGNGLYLRRRPKGGYGLYLKKQKNS